MGNKSSKSVPPESKSRFKELAALAEVFAGNVSEFTDNQTVKEVQIIDDFGVLIAKVAGQFYAIGSKCPHQGGPLVQGVFDDGRIYCPWHGACFDFDTGEIEEFPGIDCLPTYPVRVKGRKVYVYVNPSSLQTHITKPMNRLSDLNNRMVIVGGGAAGYICAQTLRQEGYSGIITIITKEKYLPYDRSMLSKTMNCRWRDIKLRDKEFYIENDIEVKMGAFVQNIDFLEHKVYVRGHSTYVSYDMLFIAIGSKPRPIKLLPYVRNGYTLRNIVTLHDMETAKKIASKIPGKKLLIIGSSFLAMELATLYSDICESVDILSRHRCPFEVVFGYAVGKVILDNFISTTKDKITGRSKIKYHASSDVKCFKSDGNGAVASCVTLRDHLILCDFVILANGVVPNTEEFKDSKLHLDTKTAAIVVNKFMETNIKHTFAGGDCCRFPIHCAAQSTATIEHWQVAQTHGRVAAINMLGFKVSIADIVPFFWTKCGDLTIKYCGHGQSYDEIFVFGSMDVTLPKFCAVYRRGKRLIAACAVNCDKLIVEMSLALQNQVEWQTEFPPCLTSRFPHEPVQVERCFGIHEDIENDLIKSDLEVAFIQALSYEKLEYIKDTYIPIQSSILDESASEGDLTTAAATNANELDKSQIEFERQKKVDRENTELTIGMCIKFPVTEFGDDIGIPVIPNTTYVDTKKYLANTDLAHLYEPKEIPQTSKKEKSKELEQKETKTPKGSRSPSPSSPRSPNSPRSRSPMRIKSTPKMLRTLVKSVVVKKEIEGKNNMELNLMRNSIMELPRQILKAERRFSNAPPVPAGPRKSILKSPDRGSLPSKIRDSGAKSDRPSNPRADFRKELAAITGKMQSPKNLKYGTSETRHGESSEIEIIKVGVINVFPERQPDLFLDRANDIQKRILVPQKLTPSTEKILTSPQTIETSSTVPAIFIHAEEELTPKKKDIFDHLHEKPNYERIASPNTTPMAKLIMKQYPEISRARAHLSKNASPILETYPNSISTSIKRDEKEKYVARINYDFERK